MTLFQAEVATASSFTRSSSSSLTRGFSSSTSTQPSLLTAAPPPSKRTGLSSGPVAIAIAVLIVVVALIGFGYGFFYYRKRAAAKKVQTSRRAGERQSYTAGMCLQQNCPCKSGTSCQEKGCQVRWGGCFPGA
jgi:hypothetical protein